MISNFISKLERRIRHGWDSNPSLLAYSCIERPLSCAHPFVALKTGRKLAKCSFGHSGTIVSHLTKRNNEQDFFH